MDWLKSYTYDSLNGYTDFVTRKNQNSGTWKGMGGRINYLCFQN
jgi:hypothetical protein